MPAPGGKGKGYFVGVPCVLGAGGVDLERVRFEALEYDDTWLRDSGPITLRGTQGSRKVLDFHFTAWGGKFEAGRDDRIVAELRRRGVLAAEAYERIDFALECVQRHPQIDVVLRQAVNAIGKDGSGHGRWSPLRPGNCRA